MSAFADALRADSAVAKPEPLHQTREGVDDALRADSAVAKLLIIKQICLILDALCADSTGIRNTRPKRRVSAKTPKMMNATMV